MVSSDVVSPLCYTTDESKTFLWCKLCLTFTRSVTECSLKKPHHIATLLFSEVVNDHTTREWNPLYHFRTYVIIIIINYCRKIAIYPCLRTLLNVFNTYYHVLWKKAATCTLEVYHFRSFYMCTHISKLASKNWMDLLLFRANLFANPELGHTE